MSDSWSSGSESSAVATGECTDGPDGVSGGLHSSGKRRKRPASELVQGACTEACGAPGPRGDYEEFQPFKNLTLTQRSIIRRVVKTLDTEEDSVVITNPLVPQSPIVYVTNAWQDMCGYNMQQAVGQNPRLTQGEGTDPETVRTMKNALIKQQPCRVRIINYRGYNHEPFWNCLSVQPIFFNRELVLFAARLQDYSHRLQRLVSLTPSQFCKSGDLFQVRVRLPELQSARSLSHPRSIDVTAADLGLSEEDTKEHGIREVTGEGAGEAEAALAQSGASSGLSLMQAPPRHVKRLAFGGLDLEPEYLLDRLRHECAELQLPCQAQEVRVHGGEVMRMEVGKAPGASLSPNPGKASAPGAGSLDSSSSSGGGGSSLPLAAFPGGAAGPGGGGMPGGGGALRALLHVMPEGTEGTYAISVMRLVGDTFEFHELYRSLRDRLTDITVPPKGSC